MSDNEDLRREMEAHLNNQQATSVEGVTDAVVASPEEEDEDALLEAMTRAVTPRFLGDDGTQTGTPSSGPPDMGLNWGQTGDEELTRYFNRRI